MRNKILYYLKALLVILLIDIHLCTTETIESFIPRLTISPIVYKVILGILGIAYLINGYAKVRSSVKDKKYRFAIFQVHFLLLYPC